MALRKIRQNSPNIRISYRVYMNNKDHKHNVLAEFRHIPGVGKTIAEDLWQLGIRSLSDIEKANPEELYEALCVLQKTRVDRCMLYVFRCAVYYASTENPDHELLKWWHWKD